jgi:hypothetical protein
MMTAALAAVAAPALADDPPKVNPGRPTITDPASLTAPRYFELELGGVYSRQPFLAASMPLLVKYTDSGGRLQYRLSGSPFNSISNGAGMRADGVSDVVAALQYITNRQGPGSWDIAWRGSYKAPAADARRGLGTGKSDYQLMFLASKDVSHSFHVDFNLALSALGRVGGPGTNQQVFASISSAMPFRDRRFGYTNEVTYWGAVPGTKAQFMTMHAITYAHRPDLHFDLGVNVGITGGAPRYQIVGGVTLFLGKL